MQESSAKDECSHIFRDYGTGFLRVTIIFYTYKYIYEIQV